MSLSKIPRELVLAVADNLSIGSLSHLIRTCRSFHLLLQQALISRITTEELASTILRYGILQNHLPTVHLALAHNAAWHTYHKFGDCSNALADACHDNRLDIVTALITHFGPEILTVNDTPDGDYCHKNELLFAVRFNNLALTTLLLESGMPAKRARLYGYPSRDEDPLDLAGMYGSAEIAEVLIKYGADAQQATSSLHHAVRCGNWGVAKVLLREGVVGWDSEFEWSGRFPLGGRSSGEIDAWVTGGIEYMTRCREENEARASHPGRERG